MKTLLFLSFLIPSVALSQSAVTCTTTGNNTANVAITCVPAGTPPPPTCPPPSETGTPPNCTCAPGYQGAPPNCTPVTPPQTCTIINVGWKSAANVPVPMTAQTKVALKITPTTASTGAYSNVSMGEWQSPAANRTSMLSLTPCDFSKPSVSSSVNVFFSAGKSNPYGFLQVPLGTPVYVNVMNTAPVSCTNCQMFYNLKP